MGQISDWVLSITAKFGYFGIIFAMFAENVFPPIPPRLLCLLLGLPPQMVSLISYLPY